MTAPAPRPLPRTGVSSCCGTGIVTPPGVLVDPRLPVGPALLCLCPEGTSGMPFLLLPSRRGMFAPYASGDRVLFDGVPMEWRSSVSRDLAAAILCRDIAPATGPGMVGPSGVCGVLRVPPRHGAVMVRRGGRAVRAVECVQPLPRLLGGGTSRPLLVPEGPEAEAGAGMVRPGGLVRFHGRPRPWRGTGGDRPTLAFLCDRVCPV